MRIIHSDCRPLLVLAICILAGCAADDAGRNARSGVDSGLNAHQYFHTTEQPLPAEWGYEGDIGPAHWGDLCPEYRLAKDGRRQSPIDLRGATPRALAPIEFQYRPERIKLVYNGHVVEEVGDGTGFIVVDGLRYTLQQFHVHTPSEHTVDGRHADMELHLVHKSADGRAAVVGVLINAGAHNPTFDRLLEHTPDAKQHRSASGGTIDFDTLLPADRSFYRYAGSLTTPPCTEDVLWLVLRSPAELSSTQIDRVRASLDRNNRPVQPLYGREILSSK